MTQAPFSARSIADGDEAIQPPGSLPKRVPPRLLGEEDTTQRAPGSEAPDRLALTERRRSNARASTSAPRADADGTPPAAGADTDSSRRHTRCLPLRAHRRVAPDAVRDHPGAPDGPDVESLASVFPPAARPDALAHASRSSHRKSARTAASATSARRSHATAARRRRASAHLSPDEAYRAAALDHGLPEVAFSAPWLGARGLGLLHPLRCPFVRLRTHWAFETAALLAVLANCVLLCLYRPRDPTDSPRSRALDTGSRAFTLVFLAEILLTLPATGLRAYVRDPSNCLDIAVVATGARTHTHTQMMILLRPDAFRHKQRLDG